MWTFGFGANMSVSTMENIKGHKVLDHVVGLVKGYKMCFNSPFLAKVEPAFANTIESTDDDEVHGVAIKLSEEDMKKLDAQEVSYSKVKVTFRGYNGRVVEDCFMYINTNKERLLPPERQIPSARYLQLVVKGAVESGLDENYIKQLKATKTYKPDVETLRRRATILSPQSLTSYTVDSLYATKSESLKKETKDDQKSEVFGYVSVLGYVIKLPKNKVLRDLFLGRDLTSRILQWYNGQLFIWKDDMGRPPYPYVASLSESEKEYLLQHLDNYLDNGETVGYLQEFLAENDVVKMMS